MQCILDVAQKCMASACAGRRRLFAWTRLFLAIAYVHAGVVTHRNSYLDCYTQMGVTRRKARKKTSFNGVSSGSASYHPPRLCPIYHRYWLSAFDSRSGVLAVLSSSAQTDVREES